MDIFCAGVEIFCPRLDIFCPRHGNLLRRHGYLLPGPGHLFAAPRERKNCIQTQIFFATFQQSPPLTEKGAKCYNTPVLAALSGPLLNFSTELSTVSVESADPWSSTGSGLFYFAWLCRLAGASSIRGGRDAETVFEITDKVRVIGNPHLATDILNRTMGFRQQTPCLLQPGLPLVFPNTETSFFLEKML